MSSLIGRYNKIMNLARNFEEGEAKSGGNSGILKVQFFFNFVANFWDKRSKLVISKV